MQKFIYSLLLFCSVVCIGCTKSKVAEPEIPCNPNISYSGVVKAIFVTNCTSAGCHDGNNLPSLGEYNVAHDASVQIKDAVSRGIMPKYSSLTPQDKAAIICWIDNGAKNN